MSPAVMTGTQVLHSMATVALLFVFVALWLFVYSARRRPAFEVEVGLLEDGARRSDRSQRGRR